MTYNFINNLKITQSHIRLQLLSSDWHGWPFGHNRHGSKIGGRSCAPFEGGAGSPSNKMWPGSRPTSVQSFILIHPTVWRHNTPASQTDRQDRSDSMFIYKCFINGRPRTAVKVCWRPLTELTVNALTTICSSTCRCKESVAHALTTLDDSQ